MNAGKALLYARTILRCNERLLRLLDNLLDYSHLEMGQLHREAAHFDPLVALERLATTFAPEAEAKQLDLVVCIHPDVPQQAFGDRRRIEDFDAEADAGYGEILQAGWIRRVELEFEVEAHFEIRAAIRIGQADIGLELGSVDDARGDLARPSGMRAWQRCECRQQRQGKQDQQVCAMCMHGVLARKIEFVTALDVRPGLLRLRVKADASMHQSAFPGPAGQSGETPSGDLQPAFRTGIRSAGAIPATAVNPVQSRGRQAPLYPHTIDLPESRSEGLVNRTPQQSRHGLGSGAARRWVKAPIGRYRCAV